MGAAGSSMYPFRDEDYVMPTRRKIKPSKIVGLDNKMIKELSDPIWFKLYVKFAKFIKKMAEAK